MEIISCKTDRQFEENLKCKLLTFYLIDLIKNRQNYVIIFLALWRVKEILFSNGQSKVS